MRASAALLLQRTGPSLAPWVRLLATVQPVTATAAAELAAAGPSGHTAAAAAAAAASSSLTDRYHQLVAAGTLQHDPAQEHCVRRLDRLSGELKLYTKLVEAHQREHAAYEAKRAALRPALMAAEEARLAAEEEAAAADAASRLGGMKSWLSAALGAPPQQAPVQRTKHQRAVLARAAVERQLDDRLGPAPAPPPAPKGVYLHGSVGSGKSLLMDLFSQLVRACLKAKLGVPPRPLRVSHSLLLSCPWQWAVATCHAAGLFAMLPSLVAHILYGIACLPGCSTAGAA
jgi:hypothetical protein